MYVVFEMRAPVSVPQAAALRARTVWRIVGIRVRFIDSAPLDRKPGALAQASRSRDRAPASKYSGTASRRIGDALTAQDAEAALQSSGDKLGPDDFGLAHEKAVLEADLAAWLEVGEGMLHAEPVVADIHQFGDHIVRPKRKPHLSITDDAGLAAEF